MSGEVRNLTNIVLDRPYAKAAFADFSGRVLAAGSAPIGPYPLSPGETGKFTIRVEVRAKLRKQPPGSQVEPGTEDARFLVSDYALAFENGNLPLFWQVENVRKDRLVDVLQGPKIELVVSDASSSFVAGLTQVSGRVTNVSTRDLDGLTVNVVWFGPPPGLTALLTSGIYDYGNTTALIQPPDLKPGETGTFLVRENVDPWARDFKLVFQRGTTPLLWQYAAPRPAVRRRK